MPDRQQHVFQSKENVTMRGLTPFIEQARTGQSTLNLISMYRP